VIDIMVDSDELDVLLDARLSGLRVATYADLVTPEFLARTGHRLTVIDRGRGDPHACATVADCEPGALSVPESVSRVRHWLADGRHQPTIYHDRATWHDVNTAGAGVPFAHWVSTLDGTLVPSGYYMAAVQFAGAKTLGFHADMSIVWDDHWHAPASPAAPGDAAHLRALAGAALAAVTDLTHAVGVTG